MTVIQQKIDIQSYINIPKQNKAHVKKKNNSLSALESKQASISVATFCMHLQAQGISMGRNQMFRWLRNNGYISSQKSTWNMPIRKYISQGLITIKESFVIIADEQVIKYSPLITSKGIRYFTQALKKEQATTNTQKEN